MKIAALVSLAVAVLAFTEASPIDRRPHPSAAGHSVPLTRNKNYKPNAKAQIAKLNARYPGLKILAGSSGQVPLTDVSPDTEVIYLSRNKIGLCEEAVELDINSDQFDHLVLRKRLRRYPRPDCQAGL